jgi:hypothetical protein
MPAITSREQLFQLKSQAIETTARVLRDSSETALMVAGTHRMIAQSKDLMAEADAVLAQLY